MLEDPIAIVIAETYELAKDAAELIMMEIEELPSVTNCANALNEESPKVWENNSNLCFDWEMGNKKETDEAFENAETIVDLELINNRIIPNSMEPRGSISSFNANTNKYEIYCSSQGVHSLRDRISAVLDIDPSNLRVITTDVGGGFGMKIFNYPEYILSLYASKKVSRPVKWISERTEAFVSDTR